MRPFAFIACLVPLIFLCSCHGPERHREKRSHEKAKLGYEGPVASGEGQALLGSLMGKVFQDSSGAFGGGEWTVGHFAVIPNPVSKGGKGPIVEITQGERSRYLPMESDADAADLYLTVTGTRHPTIGGEPSAAYRAAWGK